MRLTKSMTLKLKRNSNAYPLISLVGVRRFWSSISERHL